MAFDKRFETVIVTLHLGNFPSLLQTSEFLALFLIMVFEKP
jgi:hypothetical protein